jgi:N-acetylmuramoyl-L-alanine amidase
MMSQNPSKPAPATADQSGPSRTSQFSAWNALQVVLIVAILMATLLTLWTPSNLFSDDLINQMLLAVQTDQTPQAILPTLTPASRPRIGIVSGHWGNDSGSVCKDGLTEADVNLRIATLVKQNLTEAGYQVDLLQEFDKRLAQYQAAAIVSIHNDSCDYINDEATGFKVAAAMSTAYPEQASRLTACMIDRYKKITGLPFHRNTITNDMTNYHAFNEINSITPAAIIETGFLNLDRQILTEKPDLVAKGVSDGILCFVQNQSVEGSPTKKP